MVAQAWAHFDNGRARVRNLIEITIAWFSIKAGMFGNAGSRSSSESAVLIMGREIIFAYMADDWWH